MWNCNENIITDEMIFFIEEYLNKKFPSDFIEIIKKFDGGYPSPNKININGNEEVFNNLVSFTKEDYSYILNIMDDSEFFDKKNLVPIGEDPFGNLFCYDFSNKIEPDIIFWNHEENKNIHVCDTISELLAMLYN